MASGMDDALRGARQKLQLIDDLNSYMRNLTHTGWLRPPSMTDQMLALANLQLGYHSWQLRLPMDMMRSTIERQLGTSGWLRMVPSPPPQLGFSADIAASLQAAMAGTMGHHTLSMSAALQGLLESLSKRQAPLFDDIAARLAGMVGADMAGADVSPSGEGATAEAMGAALEAGAEDALNDAETGTPDSEMLARFYEYVLAHLPAAQRTTQSRLAIANFVLTLLTLLMTPATTWKQRQHEAADDRQHAEEAAAEAERQETANRLLQSILEQLADTSALRPGRWQHAVRETRVLARPKSGAPVVCRLVAGQPVRLVQVRREWSRVVYGDDGMLCEGWLRKKYLRDPE